MKIANNCRHIGELVPKYVEGQITTGPRMAVESHLEECPACEDMVRRYSDVQGVLADAYSESRVSPDFSNRTRERIKTGAQEWDGEPEDEELIGPPQPGFLDDIQARFGAAPWWMISGAFHALLLLLITLIGMAILRDNRQETVIVTDLEQKKEPEKLEEPKERDIIEKPVPVEMEEVSEEMPIVTHEEVEISDHVETADDSDAAETRGEDGISDVWLGGSGTVAALGLGGGGGGAFGRPGGRGGRLRRAIRGGGGKATESAVDKALEWLARHQEPDGRWNTQKHEGQINADAGVTALALLAFLGAGHTEKVGKYRGNVQRAVAWIKSKQDPKTGHIGRNYDEHWNHGEWAPYHHSMCGLALAESAGMARVPGTVAAAQAAINYSTEIHQMRGDGPSDKGGWRYKQNAPAADASVSGWFVMQLKSAKVAGLQVNPASFEGAIKFFDSIEIKDKVGSYAGGRFPYTVKANGMKGEALNPTAIGILCNLFLGRRPADLQGGAEYLLQNLPKYDPKMGKGNGGSWPMYYTYYGTLTMFQMGGHYWKQWNESMKSMLLPKQRRDGDFDGSWDPMGGMCDKLGGRVYMTATAALCLEVYYRYLPITR